MNARVQIYTDGSLLPGARGGWAALLTCRGHQRLASGFASGVTSYRMELRAVLEGLSLLQKQADVTVFCDNKTVIGIIAGSLKARAHKQLAYRTKMLAHKHDVKMKWVKAHSGNAKNERVDKEARRQAAKAKPQPDPTPNPTLFS